MEDPEATAEEVLGWLRSVNIGPGDDAGLAIVDGGGLGVATAGAARWFEAANPGRVVGAVETAVGPRWVWWERSTADALVAGGVPVARCWDVLTVHRLLHGGWRATVPGVWAWLRGLSADSLPTMGQLGLLDWQSDGVGESDDPEQPVRGDGHLRPEWTSGGWAASPARVASWAQLALIAANEQRLRLQERAEPDRALSTARSESAAEFLCAELTARGLPFDVDEAERIITEAIGPRPAGSADAERLQRERDALVLQHVSAGPAVDLRNAADVRAMLRRVGIDVPNTRAGRLEGFRHVHPVVDALLSWRKAERIATTYGYRWLDEHVD